jgi:ribosome-associated protein
MRKVASAERTGARLPFLSELPYHNSRSIRDTRSNALPRMPLTETRRMVLAAMAACDEKKGEHTRVLQLDPADSAFTDFFLITSTANERQSQAIADEIELRLKRDFGTYPNSVEGRRQGEWILMDYVDFVVHIFLRDRRAFYDIERLRKSARPVDVHELTAALTEKTLAARKKAPVKRAAKKTVTKKATVHAARKKPAKKSRKSPEKRGK